MPDQNSLDQIKSLVAGMVIRRVVAIIMILVAAVGAVLYYVYKDIRLEAINSIKSQFGTEEIKQLVKETAAKEGSNILKQGTLSDLAILKENIKKEANAFNTFLENYKIKFNDEYSSFKSDSQFLKKIILISKLGDKAIAEGDRDSYNKLRSFVENFPEPDLMNAADAELRRISAFYDEKKAETGAHITRFDANGTQIKDEDMATQHLIFALRNDADWKIRVRAANLLRNRKERGVPEVLLEASEKDISLDVVKSCIESFENITGYESPGPFSYEQAREWWFRNNKEINPKLTEQVR